LQLRVLIKSRMEDPEFLEKIENAKISAQQNVPGMSPWRGSFLSFSFFWGLFV